MDQSVNIHTAVWRYEQNYDIDIWENLLIACAKVFILLVGLFVSASKIHSKRKPALQNTDFMWIGL